jgi:hypothetical protein
MEPQEPETRISGGARSVPLCDEFALASLPDTILLWVIDILDGACDLQEHGEPQIGYDLVKDALYVAEQAGAREAAWAPNVVALYRRALAELRCPAGDALQE